MRDQNHTEHGATTVEYALLVILVVAVVIVGAWMLVDPRPGETMNSALPRTFDSIGGRVGQFGTVAQ